MLQLVLLPQQHIDMQLRVEERMLHYYEKALMTP